MRYFKSRSFIIMVFLLSLSGVSAAAELKDKLPGSAGSPELVVKYFYINYLSAFENPDIESSLSQSQSAIDKYTTEHLKNERNLSDSGADYFISAQDVCPDWVDNITIDRVRVNGDSADLELDLGNRDNKSTYSVQLKKEKSIWLMDSVKFKSRNSEFCSHN